MKKLWGEILSRAKESENQLWYVNLLTHLLKNTNMVSGRKEKFGDGCMKFDFERGYWSDLIVEHAVVRIGRWICAKGTLEILRVRVKVMAGLWSPWNRLVDVYFGDLVEDPMFKMMSLCGSNRKGEELKRDKNGTQDYFQTQRLKKRKELNQSHWQWPMN